jgi:ribosomal protein S18 acetylase RimI-like enzyme
MGAGAVPQAGDEAFLVAAAAANLAGWHDTHLRALGFRTEWREGLWLTPDAVPPIFFHAIAVRPGASAVVLAERIPMRHRASVSDPWSDLAMSGQGYVLDGDHDWMVRRVGMVGSDPGLPRDDDTAGGLIVEQVRDAEGLADFERAAALGFGSPPGPAFSWHSPPLLLDPRLQLWRGRLAGETVAVSMGFAEAGVLGIYGVATLPQVRRRGFGTALTRRAIEGGPSLPAVLQPSSTAVHLYGRLGFQRFSTFRAWDRAETHTT